MNNEVLKTIKERRSVRKFKADAVPEQLVDAVIEAGLYAPSGRGAQATTIIAVTSKQLIAELSAMNAKIMGKDFDPFFGAPVVLIVLGDKSAAPTYVYDGALTMGNMMLAAKSLGLGSIWIHRAKQEFESDEGKAILKKIGVEGDFEGIGHCCIGYCDGDEPIPAPRKPGRVFYVK